VSSSQDFFQPLQQFLGRRFGLFVLQLAQIMLGLSIDIVVLTQEGTHTRVAQQDAGLFLEMMPQFVDCPDRKAVAQRSWIALQCLRNCIEIATRGLGRATAFRLVDESG
jgi:hypothetical protein